MDNLRRCVPATASFLVSILLIGCSAQTSANSGSTVQTPTITAKAKFAYTADQGASISGYAVNTSTGALTPLSGFPMNLGIDPSAVTHDPQNRFLIVADIGAQLLHVFAINSTTGALTEVSPSPYTARVEPGTVITDPSGTHVYLYLTGQSSINPTTPGGNRVDAYNLSSTGVLTEVAGAPFVTGPTAYTMTVSTAMVTDAAGKFLYLEDGTNLYTFAIDGTTGALSLKQTLSGTDLGDSVAIDPSGAYLYTPGRLTNTILSYAIDSTSGLLTLAKSSPTAEKAEAYTIAISPSGKFAFTIENNNYLVSYTISNGVFTPVGNVYPGVYGIHNAVDPSGSFVYVPQACSNCPSGVYNVVHEFSIGSTGALTSVRGSPVTAGVQPWDITITSQ